MTPSGSGVPFELADTDFDRLREYFYRETGIAFADSKRYFVDKRVGACIQASGQADFAGWFGDLRFGTDRSGLATLISRLTVNETYFLRESYQFEALIASVLPTVVAERAGGTVRILCLPCSTGEEPYSVAISLVEGWPELDHVDVEICGVDIDAAVVDIARRGVYGPRSLQRVGRATRERFFEPLDDGRHRISPDLAGVVDSSVANVCDAASMGRYRDFDVVFCRNLLIYFDALSSRRAAEHLFAALRPGGWLFLGHSESMSRISSIFDPVRLPDGLVYRRPGGTQR